MDAQLDHRFSNDKDVLIQAEQFVACHQMMMDLGMRVGSSCVRCNGPNLLFTADPVLLFIAVMLDSPRCRTQSDIWVSLGLGDFDPHA